MNHPPDDELVRHARALRGLARALVGAQDADDLVQETAAQVLRSAPANVGSWFSWFGGVMRRRAARSHRDAARRTRREQQVAGERELAGESALRIAAHRETIARLDAALLGLSEPYQGTLLLRYFEDLTPTEIASRTGQPVATVKSRLQRGVGMLRERLGEGDGDDGPRDWRAGLIGAFGLGRGDSAVAGAMAVGTMVGTMAMTKWLLGAAAVTLAAFLWWQREASPTPVATGPAPNDAPVVAATGSAPTPNDERVAVPRNDVPEPTNLAGAAEFVTFVGRCVDDAGAPLAGVAVGAATCRQDGGRQLASDDQTTGERGEFVARLPAAPKCYQRLELKAADRCDVDGQFWRTEPGQRVELGDIVVPLACSYHGRVVDTDGVPQAGVMLELRGYQSPEKQLRAVVYNSSGPVTDRDGTFTSLQKLPADRYQLVPKNRKLVQQATKVDFTLGATARDAVLELVVEPAPTPCRGIVVNEGGEPIAGARLRLDDGNADTGRDGRFELLPDPNQQGVQRRVSCRAEGFEDRDTSWRLGDTTELRIVLAAAPTLTVRVVDARDRRPVARFETRVVPPNVWSGTGAMQDHPDGTCRVAVAAGRWWVRVRAADEQLAPSAFVPVQILPGQSAAVAVELEPWLTRRLVLTNGRAPVAGVMVQLLDPGDVAVRCNTETFPFDDCKLSGPPLACIVHQGATDQDGALALRGPRGSLALRLSGGGLALQIVQPIRLDEDGDLRVVAQRGAHWRGKLVPEAVARELWSLRQPQPNVAPEKVGIELGNADGESLHRYFDAPFPFAADGSFAIDGIRAGTWHVLVRAKHGLADFAATTITVSEGQQLEQDVDVQALALAHVTLRIRVDGEPAARTYVNIMGSHARDSWGQRHVTQSMGRTDDTGCFRLLTCVGELQAHVYWDPATGKGGMLRIAAPLRTAGEQELVLDVQLGALDLTVLTPEGQPAGGLFVQLNVGSSRPTGDDVTAADGTLRQSPIAAGRYELRARPVHLLTQQQRNEFAQANGWPALEQAWIAVGAIDVAPGPARPQTVRLPAAWSR